MKLFDVQGIEIRAPRDRVFAFIRDPKRLPDWAEAFRGADQNQARLQTPQGEVDIALETTANADTGTVDWRLTFPDGAVALAQSRVTPTTRDTVIYSFVLHAPPAPLEAVEGALAEQIVTLSQELKRLKTILERND